MYNKNILLITMSVIGILLIYTLKFDLPPNVLPNNDSLSTISSNSDNKIYAANKNNNSSSAILSNSIVDKFGIKELYTSSIDTREWYSKWDNGHARSWNDNQNDPDDPEFVTKHKGVGSWKTDGDGTLKISGNTPRMYVIDPTQLKSWHNVEITVYGMRVSDHDIAHAGIISVARTNHFIDDNNCDTRGYSGRFTLDGRIDFEKEISHHASNGYTQTATKHYWPKGMPKDVWIGYKFIVYDMVNGNVKLELWMDTTDGFNGGNWIKVDEFIDDGTNFGKKPTGCKSNIDPYSILDNSDERPGSETGKPNLAVYFRSDEIDKNGLLYKKASIREIQG